MADPWQAWEAESRREENRKRPPKVRFVLLEHLPCRTCGSRWRLPMDQLQIRGADEPMHSFYICDRGCKPDAYAG